VSAVLALGVGCLYGIGVYLLLQRTLTRIVMGLVVLGHGANLLLLLSGGRAGRAPIVHDEPTTLAGFADPMPQALALTAIVISFGITAFLLALAWRSWSEEGTDEVEDDVEDRRIAQLAGTHRPAEGMDTPTDHPLEIPSARAERPGEVAGEGP
jgi:multicomponent Na+:H+ antiporter subunit C